MRKFKDLTIWHESINLVTEVYKTCAKLPETEKYGLRSQMQRASVSIPSNIAEGCSRKSDREFARFLEISLGSAFELETQFCIINELQLIPKDMKQEDILTKLEKLQKMINSLKTKVLKA